MVLIDEKRKARNPVRSGYLFFIFLVLLGANPWVVRWFLAPVGPMPAPVLGGVVVHFLMWAVLAVAVFRSRGERPWMRGILWAAGFYLSVLFFIGIDRLAGRWVNVPGNPLFSGFIFPPDTEVRYETSEFRFVAQTNDWGIRDRNYKLGKDTCFRILVLGDSNTFGWGIDASETYENQLQNRLRESGICARVFNFGQPGGFTLHYKKNLARAIDFVRPDLVVVGLLQSDDLRQSVEAAERRQGVSPTRLYLKAALYYCLKNFKRLYECKTNIDKNPPEKIRETWQKEVAQIKAAFTARQREKYLKTDPAFRQLLEAGAINAYLVRAVLSDTLDHWRVNFPENPAVRRGFFDFREDLRELKKITRSHGADLLLLNIPYCPYFSRNALIYKELHCFEEPVLLSLNRVDSMYQAAADFAGAPMVHFTDWFKVEDPRRKLYFHYDGHLTPEAHRMLGDSIARYLIPRYFDAFIQPDEAKKEK
ncbi:MAG: hypothetical protein D6714_18965 [Bacteroidetes bacterium]|nr:MAG: hypothetical protein D6714_18965 [Bacteroidota bacterium]